MMRIYAYGWSAQARLKREAGVRLMFGFAVHASACASLALLLVARAPGLPLRQCYGCSAGVRTFGSDFAAGQRGAYWIVPNLGANGKSVTAATAVTTTSALSCLFREDR